MIGDESPGRLRRLVYLAAQLGGWVVALGYGSLTVYAIYHGPYKGELTDQVVILASASAALCLFYLPPLWRPLLSCQGLLKVARYFLGGIRALLAPIFLFLVLTVAERGLPRIDDGVEPGSHGCPADAKPRGTSPPDGFEIWCEQVESGDRHGPYAAWWPNRKPKVDGWYESGQSHGTWTHWYKNGKLKERSIFRNGQRHGEWSEWHPDGTRATQGSYVDGDLHGRVRRWHPNGRLYLDIRYDQGHPPFDWQEYFPDGTRAGNSHITLLDELPKEWQRAVCHDDPAKIVRHEYRLVYSRVGRTEHLVVQSVRREPLSGALSIKVRGSPDWAPAHIFWQQPSPGQWLISEPFAPFALRPWIEAGALERYRDQACD